MLPGSGSCNTMISVDNLFYYAKGSQIYRDSLQNYVHAYNSPNGGNYTNMCIRMTVFEGGFILGWAVKDNGTISRYYLGFSSIKKIDTEVPEVFRLYQNYPNPFNPVTKIKFDIPSDVKGKTVNIKLVVYDVLSREVATLVNEQLKHGSYEVEWDGFAFASGVYFYSLITEEYTVTKKLILLK